MSASALLTRAVERYRSSQESIWALGTQVISSGANFLTTVLMVRLIGLTEFGRFSIAFLLIMVVRNFQQSAVLTPMSTVGPKMSDSRQPAYRGFILTNSLGFALLSSLLLLACLFAAGHLLRLEWIWRLAPALAVANFTCNMAEFFRRHCFNQKDKYAAMAVEIVRYVIQLTALALIAFATPEWLSPDTALLALAAGGIAGSIIGVMRFGNLRWNSAFNRTIWPRHWHLIKWLTPGIAFQTLQGPGCIFFAGFFFGEALIGGLRAMQNISNLLQMPINGMQNVAANTAARKWHKMGGEALRRYLSELMIAMVGFSTILTIVVALLRDHVIEFTMGLHDDSLGILLILFCVANVASAINFVSTVGLQATEKGKPITLATAAGAILSLTLVAIFAPISGAVSVPVARIATVLLSSSLLFLSLRREFRSHAKERWTANLVHKENL